MPLPARRQGSPGTDQDEIICVGPQVLGKGTTIHVLPQTPGTQAVTSFELMGPVRTRSLSAYCGLDVGPSATAVYKQVVS